MFSTTEGGGIGVGVGARMSGIGPEKSLPVIRANICISVKVVTTNSTRGMRNNSPTGMLLFKQ